MPNLGFQKSMWTKEDLDRNGGCQSETSRRDSIDKIKEYIRGGDLSVQE